MSKVLSCDIRLQVNSEHVTFYHHFGLYASQVSSENYLYNIYIYIWFKYNLEVLHTQSSIQLGFEPMTSRSWIIHFKSLNLDPCLNDPCMMCITLLQHGHVFMWCYHLTQMTHSELIFLSPTRRFCFR